MRDFIFSKDMIQCARENPDLYNWENISYFVKLPEDFIREFKDQLYWSGICKCQNLSKDFIREHINYMKWDWFIKNKDFNLDNILEFKNKLSSSTWDSLSYFGNLPRQFIVEYISKLNLFLLLRNENISEETKNYIRMFI